MSDNPIEQAANSNDPDFVAAVANDLGMFIKSLPPTDPSLDWWLGNLATLYYQFFCLTRETAAIEAAIAIGRQLADGMPRDHVDYTEVRSNLGRFLTSVYETFEDASALDEAIAVLDEAVDGAVEPTGKHSAMSNLGSALYARHLATGGIADIERAAGAFTELVNVTARDHPMRLVRLLGLGDALRVWFQASPDPQVLAEAVAAHRQLRDEVPRSDPERARILANLSGLLGQVPSQPLALLEECVACCREALDLTPADSNRHPVRTADLSAALGQLAEHTGDLTAFEEASHLLRQAIPEFPSDSWPRREMVTMLGRYLVAAYRTDRNAQRLEEAVDVLGEAAEQKPAGQTAAPKMLVVLATALTLLGRDAEEVWQTAALAAETAGDRAAILNNQAAALMDLYDTTHDPGALDRAIDLSRLAVQTSPPDETDGPDVELVAALASAQFRHLKHGNENEVAEVGAAYTDVVRRTDAGHPKYLSRLSLLGAVTVYWLELATRGPELMDAVVTFRQAATALTTAQQRELGSLPFLDKALTAAYLSRGDRRFLAEAIQIGRLLVAITPPGDRLLVTNLSNLATSLTRHSDLTGDTASRMEAVALYERAIALDEGRDVHLLANLLGAFTQMPEQAGGQAKLETILASFRDALNDITADHPGRSHLLVNAAGALGERATRHRDRLAGLARWQAELEFALRLLGPEHPERERFATALAEARATTETVKARQLSELREVLDLHRELLESIPQDDPARWANLTAMSVALWDLYAATADKAALDEAIARQRQALGGYPEGHPFRAAALSGLGRGLRDAAEAGEGPSALSEALACYREAASIATAPAKVRADAAAMWGYVARKLGDNRTALTGLAMAVRLLDEVAWRGLSRPDQEQMLSDYGSLAADAAAVAVEVGKLERAVELLEQGRGVLLAQALDTRASYESLHARFPDLADELATIHDQLETGTPPSRLSPPGEMPEPIEETAERMVSLTNRRRQLLQEIRRHPEFRRFLRPPRYASLKEAASGGPVIIINISEFRCDALIVASGGLHHVPLENVSRKGVDESTFPFFLGLDGAQRPASSRVPGAIPASVFVEATLGWLDERVTGPILNELLALPDVIKASPRPRIWWCPTGPLAFYPLHAAGHTANDREDTTAVMDRVVSSYTPTLRALIHARQRQSQDDGTSLPHTLIVAMPKTPHQQDLPAAATEVENYKRIFPEARVLTSTEASRHAVMEQLRHCSWVHFACHGSHDASKPSASSLHLFDGPLSAAEISRLRIENGEFAFLSACRTSQASTRITEESLTLASAMSLAGYRHVIGTLWSIEDSLAPFVAKAVYAALTQNSTTDAADAATALHATQNALRTMRPDAPSLWAPYIHVGP
jgi:CHAT domain